MTKSYKRLGDIIILQGISLEQARRDGKQLLEKEKWAKSVYYLQEIQTNTRTPRMVHLYGEVKEQVIHKELNTKFVIPIHQTMFSPGNHHERLRLIQEVPQDSIIIDMFCAVGNLSMPVAVNREDVKIIGIEHHRPTFNALVNTITLNKVTNRFSAIFGDNRVVTPQRKGDIVFMGFFGWDEIQLRVGIQSLKDEKGRLYLHFNEKRREPLTELNEITKKVLDEKKLKGELLHSRVIKKSGPNKLHYVQIIQVE